MAEDGFELQIFLPPLPRSWDYRHIPPQPLSAALEMKPRTWCLLGAFGLSSIPNLLVLILSTEMIARNG